MERFRGEEAGSGQLLILDEACAALEYAVLDEALLWDSVLRKPSRLEMILTGRHPADWMLRAADYATELKETAHPLQDGLPARCGIEY